MNINTMQLSILNATDTSHQQKRKQMSSKSYLERIEDQPLISEKHGQIEQLKKNGINPFSNELIGKDPDDTRNYHNNFASFMDWDLFGKDTYQSCINQVFEFCGRIRFIRKMGKAIFIKIQNSNTERWHKKSYDEYVPTDNFLQIFVGFSDVGEETFRLIESFNSGDIITVLGVPMRTKTGELSLKAEKVKLLTKSMRALPIHGGYSDIEIKYRQRYADLNVNANSKKVFKARTTIVKFIRKSLEMFGCDEVETPMLHPVLGGANAKPFVTHHNALDMPFYLRIAPELYLKRLIVAGYDGVYEINRNFRNEGVSTQHNPEFTMVEFYKAYAQCDDLMKFIEGRIYWLAREISGAYAFDEPNEDNPDFQGAHNPVESHATVYVKIDGEKIEISNKFERISIIEEVAKLIGCDRENVWDRNILSQFCQDNHIAIHSSDDEGKLIYSIFEHKIEKNIKDFTFVTEYPTSVSPLARKNNQDSRIVDRFELFVMGREIANGFSELNDPQDQYERFAEQLRLAKETGSDEMMQMDEDYIRALEYGMPPTAGAGIGIDRLTMILTGSPSIKDVILFPHMRQETF
jgi:lysyl-tRNA synthetase, class II